MRRFTIRGLATFASIVGAPLLVTAQQPGTTQQPVTQSGQATQSQVQPGQSQGGQTQGAQSSPTSQPGTQASPAGGQPGVQAGGQSSVQQASSQQGMQHGQAQDLTSFIVHKLRLGNESEVELGQLASKQAKHPKVKEFAQQMVQEHQQMIQKLQGIHGGTGAAGGPAAAAGAQRGATVRPSDPGSAGSPGGAAEPQIAGQPIAGGASAGVNASDRVPAQLVAMTDQHCRTKAQMTQQMLQKHQGEDFDMAYIGQQILAHTDMLAGLQALRAANLPQLQPIVAEAERATREHLDMATSIADQLKGSSTASSERNSSSSQSNERGSSNSNRGSSSNSKGKTSDSGSNRSNQ